MRSGSTSSSSPGIKTANTPWAVSSTTRGAQLNVGACCRAAGRRDDRSSHASAHDRGRPHRRGPARDSASASVVVAAARSLGAPDRRPGVNHRAGPDRGAAPDRLAVVSRARPGERVLDDGRQQVAGGRPRRARDDDVPAGQPLARGARRAPDSAPPRRALMLVYLALSAGAGLLSRADMSWSPTGRRSSCGSTAATSA